MMPSSLAGAGHQHRDPQGREGAMFSSIFQISSTSWDTRLEGAKSGRRRLPIVERHQRSICAARQQSIFNVDMSTTRNLESAPALPDCHEMVSLSFYIQYTSNLHTSRWARPQTLASCEASWRPYHRFFRVFLNGSG